MSNLQEHAERELRALGYDLDHLDEAKEDPTEDEWTKICQNVLELIHTFSTQGHSGSSAPYVLGLFAKIASWEPVSPLKGTEDEWTEITPGEYQNKRCPHVFKENGQAYDSKAVIFREPDGMCFTSRDSRRNVTFPYIPKRQYVDVAAR